MWRVLLPDSKIEACFHIDILEGCSVTEASSVAVVPIRVAGASCTISITKWVFLCISLHHNHRK